jgi:hypothetical protein
LSVAKSKDRRAGFPKVTYRAVSGWGSHSARDNEADAMADAKAALTWALSKKWAAVDKITVERIYVEELPDGA